MNNDSIELEELEPLFRLHGHYDKARQFCTLIAEELELRHSFLTPEEAGIFGWYYRKFLDGAARHSYISHRHSQRLQHLVGFAAEGQRVLDAGCGLGSESILCGILGAQVTGVDLSELLLSIAKKRLQLYESVLGKTISTEFRTQSVFDIQDSFDVIWGLEAISHITPPDRFICFARNHLNRGGKLILSDANKLNPLVYRYMWRTRRRIGPHKQMMNPQTGEMVLAANEQLFSVFSIKNLLLSNGFVIESFVHSGLMPFVPWFNIHDKNVSIYLEELILEKLMNLIPLFRWHSAIYTLVATPR